MMPEPEALANLRTAMRDYRTADALRPAQEQEASSQYHAAIKAADDSHAHAIAQGETEQRNRRKEADDLQARTHTAANTARRDSTAAGQRELDISRRQAQLTHRVDTSSADTMLRTLDSISMQAEARLRQMQVQPPPIYTSQPANTTASGLPLQQLNASRDQAASLLNALENDAQALATVRLRNQRSRDESGATRVREAHRVDTEAIRQQALAEANEYLVAANQGIEQVRPYLTDYRMGGDALSNIVVRTDPMVEAGSTPILKLSVSRQQVFAAVDAITRSLADLQRLRADTRRKHLRIGSAMLVILFFILILIVILNSR